MKLGIVGLPNVGKSTLFNAITNAGAQSANYAFCTIEPIMFTAIIGIGAACLFAVFPHELSVAVYDRAFV